MIFNPNKTLLGSKVEVYINGELFTTGTLNQIINPHDWEVDGTVYSLSDSQDVEIDNNTVRLYTIE